MPIGARRRRNHKKLKRARKGKGRSRTDRLTSGVLQQATIVETVEFTDVNPNLGYNFNFNLSQFVRASALAPNFKWYKAVSVEWTMEALYNTFQDGTTGAEVTIPYYYQTMNRTQDTTGINLKDMQAMGAKPKKMVGKTVTRYTPNWCSPGLSTYATSVPPGAIARFTQLGLKAQYSYLASPTVDQGAQNLPVYIVPALPVGTGQDGMNAVNANQVIYNGHTVFVDQEVPTGVLQPVARVVCTVTWHFKDPHYVLAPEKYVDAVPKLSNA